MRHGYVSKKREPLNLSVGLCRRKFTYETEGDAIVVAASRLRFIKKFADTDRLRVYKCEVCGKWHLTKKKEKE